MGWADTNGPRRGGLALALAAMAAAPLIALALPRDGKVAIVAAPGTGADAMARLVARAGGAIVRLGPTANVIVATSDAPGFVARLYGAGAWLVLDALVADACFSSPTRDPR
jgi:hypothetical protein